MPKPFLTPSTTSEEYQCRTITQPSNKEWLGVFNSALLELLNPYNWEQVNDTDLTIEEAIAICQIAINSYFANEQCAGAGCTLPDLDTPPFRLGMNGRFEQLDNGEWGEPTGEYEIPPTPARTEPTAAERKCAAAANAAHVMFLLYEAITDEIALGGDTLQVAAAMVAALVTAVGGWIAAPVYAIIQLTIALFAGMIEILQALGADVWTEDFNEKFKCALLACATDTGDVVTFDLACIREEIATPVDLLSPTLYYDALLFAQVLFLLETITMDGLNAAGATTDVASPNCDVCGEWCYRWDRDDGGFGGWTIVAGAQNSQYVYMGRDFASTEVTYIQLEYTTTGGGTGGSSAAAIYSDNPPATPNRIALLAPVNTILFIDWHGSQFMDGAGVGINSDDPAATWSIRTITIAGNGANPFGTSNCEA